MPVSKVPPHNEEAESSVLGSILIDKDAILNAVTILKPEHFYIEANRIIYESMLFLYEKREPLDLVTLKNDLRKKGTLAKIGGASYLGSLTDTVPTSANVIFYAKIIADNFIKRVLISLSAKITEMALSEENEGGRVLDKAEEEIFRLSQTQSKQGFLVLKDALASSFDRLDELQKQSGGLRGIPTGFSDLDDKLAGMQPSNLLILAARPGMGKTAFVLNVAQQAAVEYKLPIGIFSLEMSREELVDRLLVSQADIDAWRLKTGKLSEEDFQKLSDAMGYLAEAPIYIDDTPGLNILEMRTKARKLQAETGVKLLIVDYLQLVDSGRRFDNRVQEVSLISQSLKNLARELKIPILAVSQLSRAVESRGSRVPQLADLRESGAIEQDSDVVMFLYKEIDDRERLDQFIVKLLIAKHRNGPLAELDLLFRGDRIRFYSVEKRREG